MGRVKNILSRENIQTIRRFALQSGAFLMLIQGLQSCQFPYEAEIDEKNGLISIDGSLVKGDSLQTVIVSRSTSLYKPEFDPVSGCAVFIEDELGNLFTLTEISDGTYQASIDDDQLVYNRDYKLIVVTPDDKRYESEYETILQGAPVDSIYYERDQKYFVSEDDEKDGIQFYLDLKGSVSDSRYYRWSLTETWEYTSISLVHFYYYMGDSIMKEYLPSPSEYYYCWTTRKIPGLYSSSTVNLTSNLKKKIPLHFVSNETSRLSVKYSLMVEQYSLNEGAYSYWNQTKSETEETGGLYTQQPGQSESNLSNIDDGDEEVLGYFWASSKTKKRIFTLRPHNMVIFPPPCKLEPFDISLHQSGPFPIYIYLAPGDFEYSTNRACMNCTLAGGSNKRPSFWE